MNEPTVTMRAGYEAPRIGPLVRLMHKARSTCRYKRSRKGFNTLLLVKGDQSDGVRSPSVARARDKAKLGAAIVARLH